MAAPPGAKTGRSSRSPKPSSLTLTPKHRDPSQEADLNLVHEELEKLNIATDVINKLELQLDEARNGFRDIQSSWSQQLEKLSKKLGGCIEKARPYYQARLQARQIQEEAQKSALRFERANSMHAVAKQQVALTQESLNRQDPKDVDPACLEVLNHHIQRVNEAEVERLQSEEEHRHISMQVEESNRKVSQLEKELGRQIKKSRPYFDFRFEFTRVLEEQKALVHRIEAEIRQKKIDYQTSLKNLEKISEDIHEKRLLGTRESGVGEETPAPADVKEGLRISVPEGNTPPPIMSPKARATLERLKSSPSPRSPKVASLISTLEEAEQPEAAKGRRPSSFAGLQSGVLLLAQELSDAGILKDRRIRAFSFPPEDLDVEYRTVPEGIKPFPTPPHTPAESELPLSGMPYLESPSLSECSSLASVNVEDEKVGQMLRSHTCLIQEIEAAGVRAKLESQLASEETERGSASGESS